MFVPLDSTDVVWTTWRNRPDLNLWATRADGLIRTDELPLDLDPTEGFTFAHVKEITA